MFPLPKAACDRVGMAVSGAGGTVTNEWTDADVDPTPSIHVFNKACIYLSKRGSNCRLAFRGHQRVRRVHSSDMLIRCKEGIPRPSSQSLHVFPDKNDTAGAQRARNPFEGVGRGQPSALQSPP